MRTNSTMNILNCRSNNDRVLKYVLKKAKPKISPIGLNNINEKIDNHLIKNIDLTK